MKAKLSDKKAVFLAAMVCCFLWGSATPAIKIGYQIFQIDGGDTSSIILFAGIRFLLAGLLVVMFQSLLRRRFLKPEREALPSIFALSMAQTVVQYLLFYVGLAHTSGVHGTILSGTGGFFSILMASLLFRYEKLTGAKVLGCVAGFGGIVIMNLSGMAGESLFQVSLLGEGFVLFSQMSYALSSILVKRFSSRFDVVMLSGWQFVLGGSIMILVGLLTGGRVGLPTQAWGWALMLYMGLISAVAYSLWGVLLQYNPVSSVTIYTFLTPVFGVLLSAAFLGEAEQAFSLRTLAALVLVCVGIFAVNRRQKETIKP
ncbi:DMT family transporter [Flavonifractor sp. HCP28S3_F3]|uniref:DMT family transporter n=1 Tax=Flavonifractor sp. HCP28S3_F3 TaxID=3438939 RepID=UPI003F894AB5